MPVEHAKAQTRYEEAQTCFINGIYERSLALDKKAW